MATFRFLDLAAELRNRVYEEALTHDIDNNRLAAVPLLAVCKQIRSEAKGIFHELRVFTIDARAEGPPSNLQLTGDVGAFFSEENATVINIYEFLPKQMLAFPEIRVHLSFPSWGQGIHSSETWHLGLMRFLYALGHFLNSDTAERKVTIIYEDQCEPGRRIPEKDLYRTLSQLQVLGPHVELKYDIDAIPWAGFIDRLQPSDDDGWLEDRPKCGIVNPVEIYNRHSKTVQEIADSSEFPRARGFLQTVREFLTSTDTDFRGNIVAPYPALTEKGFQKDQFEVEVAAIGLETVAILANKKDKRRMQRARKILKQCVPVEDAFGDKDYENYVKKRELGSLCEFVRISKDKVCKKEM